MHFSIVFMTNKERINSHQQFVQFFPRRQNSTARAIKGPFQAVIARLRANKHAFQHEIN